MSKTQVNFCSFRNGVHFGLEAAQSALFVGDHGEYKKCKTHWPGMFSGGQRVVLWTFRLVFRALHHF